MSHHEKKLFRPLLVVVFSLSAALMFAFGRGPALYVESGTLISTPILSPPVVNGHAKNDLSETNGSAGISGAVTQRNFRRDHDLTVEMISVGPDGFQPTKLTRPSGRFLLAINNRSGLKELKFQLIRENGTVVQEARVDPKQPNWRGLVNLPAGTYRLTETSHMEWVCRIDISTHK
jgi:hypothetical protein